MVKAQAGEGYWWSPGARSNWGSVSYASPYYAPTEAEANMAGKQEAIALYKAMDWCGFSDQGDIVYAYVVCSSMRTGITFRAFHDYCPGNKIFDYNLNVCVEGIAGYSKKEFGNECNSGLSPLVE